MLVFWDEVDGRPHQIMPTPSPEKKNYNQPFKFLVIASGVAACLYSIFHFPSETIDLRFLFLATITIAFSSRFGIEFSQHKVNITVSDTFVFLTLLLYGGEAAVVVAGAEAFCSSFRFSKLWTTRFFNGALLACSTFLTGVVLKLIFGSPVELTQGDVSGNFVTAICVMALTQYVVNSGIAGFQMSLKTLQPFWPTWKDHFLWTSLTYFAGASAAAVAAKLISDSGFYALLATFPMVSIIYFTYQTYRKQIEAKTEQIEQAARHAEEREHAGQELRESEEHFRGAFDYAAVGMALLGKDGQWLRVNQSFCSLVGYSEQALLKMDSQSITHPDDLDNELANMYRILERQSVTLTWEKRFVHKMGDDIWAIISLSAVADSEGNPMHFVMQAQDNTARKRSEEKLHHAAFYDKLTSLPNRALFTEHLQLAIDRTKRDKDHLYAVIFLDVDRFKNVNDSLGHAIGDQLLTNVARRLEKCIRPKDMVSRFGGDEFAVLLNGLKSVADATAVAERIQRDLAIPFSLSGHEVFSGGSIGMALSTPEYTFSDEIIRDADTAMYRAKEQGRARFEIFHKVMHERVISRLELETDLRRAVEREEFEVYYQPIMNLQTSSISGFEALVRWQHPDRGLVSPAEFISVAEETELIVPLGRWVLLQACRQIQEWQTKLNFPSLTISVNLSGQQFKQPHIVEEIKQILYQTKLETQCLNLEITESVVMDDGDAATAVLRQLRSLGIQLSIDDFGTGYSSLSYLHRFPVNILKVDRSFVNRMAIDEESLGIVETIVTLAAKLKMKVVAEGIETEAQLNQLTELNCAYGQGYLFSKPMIASEAEEFIQKEQERMNLTIVPPPDIPEGVELKNENYLM